ncbi:MAG: methionyl-tRNA formyltransferase [Planctomycetes bacterium]|nr:methionyl-tRNA formyltransferase [Planctomycetota bacterium]
MGTGPFAVPMFEALLASRHQVLLLVTKPRPAEHGRGGPPPNPMRAAGERHNIPIFDPESINTPEARDELAKHQPDVLVVADYGQILAPETLALARLGGVNLHGSLLPKYRGAAPINWAIYNGDAESGVTVIQMTPRVDAGPALAITSTPIEPDEDAVALEHRLSQLGAPLVVTALEQLAAGQSGAIPQDPALVSPARRLRKTDAAIDWQRTAQQLKDQVRAFEPWPRTLTFLHRAHGGAPLRLILGHVQIVASDAPQRAPGQVAHAGKQAASGETELLVQTGAGQLRIDSLQPAGKRMMNVAEFLRGHPIDVGDYFGPESPSATGGGAAGR